MKKKMILAVALCYVAASGAFAQETIKINEKSDKGFYLRIGGGYSLGIGKTSGGGNGLMPANNTVRATNTDYRSQNGKASVDESTSKTTKTNAAFSLGEGINMALGIGYMFNDNIGLELSGDYLLGASNTVEDKSTSKYYKSVSTTSNTTVTQSSGTGTTTNSMTRTSLSITPAVRFVAPISGKISMYSRIGVVVPVSDKMVYEYRESDSQYYSQKVNNKTNSSNNSNSNTSKTMEFEPYFRVGYTAAIGVNYSLGKHLSLFGEINGVSDSFEAKKSTITKWNQYSNSSSGSPSSKNLLENLDIINKETEYLKEYVVDNKSTSTADKNKPGKDVSFSLPASSIGLAVGVALKF